MSRAGFSILETLVAFVVLALALSALLPAQSRMTERSAESRTKWVAAELARSRLAAAGITTPLQPGSATGIWQDHWAWQITITPYQGLPAQEQRAGPLFEVTATVDDARTGRRLVTLTTLRRGGTP